MTAFVLQGHKYTVVLFILCLTFVEEIALWENEINLAKITIPRLEKQNKQKESSCNPASWLSSHLIEVQRGPGGNHPAALVGRHDLASGHLLPRWHQGLLGLEVWEHTGGQSVERLAVWAGESFITPGTEQTHDLSSQRLIHEPPQDAVTQQIIPARLEPSHTSEPEPSVKDSASQTISAHIDHPP